MDPVVLSGRTLPLTVSVNQLFSSVSVRSKIYGYDSFTAINGDGDIYSFFTQFF